MQHILAKQENQYLNSTKLISVSSYQVYYAIKKQMLQLILNGLTQVSAGTSTRLRRVFAFPAQPVGIT